MSFKTLVIGALFVVSGCMNSEPVAPLSEDRPLFQGVPADGGGNKIVIPVDFTIPGFGTCPNGATVDLHIVGWIQDRPGGEPPHQPGIVSFYFEFIFLNAAGDAYVWHQVASERFYLDGNGDFVFHVVGRTLDNIGRIVINITNGEVVEFEAGREPFVDELVCAALT